MACTIDDQMEISKCLTLLSEHEKLAAKVYYMFQQAINCTDLGITSVDDLAPLAVCMQTDVLTGEAIDVGIEYTAAVAAGATPTAPGDVGEAIACLRNSDPSLLAAMERYLRCKLIECIGA